MQSKVKTLQNKPQQSLSFFTVSSLPFQLTHNFIIFFTSITLKNWFDFAENSPCMKQQITDFSLQLILTGNCYGAKWGGGVGVLDKECVGSENGTADVTFCPLRYRKEANTDEKLFTNPKCQKANSSSKVNSKRT